MNLTFKEYQERGYQNIQPHADNKDEVLNWSVGLSEEVGEAMNLIKHHYWGKEEINQVEIAKEVSDIIWYCMALLSCLNIDLETACLLNLKKLEHRFQNGFSNEASQARHESEKKFSDTEEYKELIEKLIRKED